MSNERAIYYRRVDSCWYVMNGTPGVEYRDGVFLNYGTRFNTKEACLLCADRRLEEQTGNHHGVVFSPANY